MIWTTKNRKEEQIKGQHPPQTVPSLPPIPKTTPPPPPTTHSRTYVRTLDVPNDLIHTERPRGDQVLIPDVDGRDAVGVGVVGTDGRRLLLLGAAVGWYGWCG